MTVQELIDELNKVQDKSAEAIIEHDSWYHPVEGLEIGDLWMEPDGEIMDNHFKSKNSKPYNSILIKY